MLLAVATPEHVCQVGPPMVAESRPKMTEFLPKSGLTRETRGSEFFPMVDSCGEPMGKLRQILILGERFNGRQHIHDV